MRGDVDLDPAVERRATVVLAHAAALAYGVLAPLQWLVLHGTARLVLPVLALASLAVCLGTLLRLRDPRAAHRPLLLAVVLLPLLNGLTRLAFTGDVTHTAVVMLAVVLLGAASRRAGRLAAALVAVAAAWLATVLTAGPQPAAAVPVAAVELAVACGVSLGVCRLRATLAEWMHTKAWALDEQVQVLRRIRADAERNLDQFRGVFEHSPVGLALADEHGRYARVNAALCRVMGRTEEELLGHSSAEFTHPDDLAMHARAGDMVRAAPDGIAVVEKRYVRPDGESRWVWVTWTHVRGPEGQEWTVMHVQDVTEQHQTLEHLARSRRTAEAAADVARASQRGDDPRSLALAHLHALTGASAALLYEPDPTGRLVITAAWPHPEGVGYTVPDDEVSAARTVWERGEALFVTDTSGHPMVNQRLASDLHASSAIWEPVGTGDQRRGVLAAIWDRADADLAHDGRAAVEVLAAETGAALEAESMRRRLELLGTTDPLTGLANRRGWDAEVGSMVARAHRAGLPVTLALVDLDRFKAYNDAHGHQAGDELLAAFAHEARATLRSTDVMARWGGEEFVVALFDCDEAHAAESLSRLHRSVPGGETCSIGYAALERHEPVADALRRADAALYRAKAAGRDRIVAAGSPDAELAIS